MNVNNVFLRSILKQFKLPESTLKYIQLAANIGSVDGAGFPQELLAVSAPLIARGLLNFAILQMDKTWIYPYWVYGQLDHTNPLHIPRSQNPLLINITNRNWIGIGSPHGYHEAIVDPRGLVTPLPREWSLDVWLLTEDGIVFPSLADDVQQEFDVTASRVVTAFQRSEINVTTDCFVQQSKTGLDVLFHRTSVHSTGKSTSRGILFLALRPFNPEGVGPIESIVQSAPHVVNINDMIGISFSETPSLFSASSRNDGDIGNMLRSAPSLSVDSLRNFLPDQTETTCSSGLAHAVAAFELNLKPHEELSIISSIPLAGENVLRRLPGKQTWRTSFRSRLEQHRASWRREIEEGASVLLPSTPLQNVFEASRLTLLQFQDGEFISPGPYTYHHFWFRDAVTMLRALDVLCYTKRTRKVIEGFTKRMNSDGFFAAPEGEWDSNGAVLWYLLRHHELTRSLPWLKRFYPTLARAANWIIRKRKLSSEHSGEHKTSGNTKPGLMPRSLSAEHLGTVDQYYWDSFWSLGGLQAISRIAQECGHPDDALRYRKESENFERDILHSLHPILNSNKPFIPSTPFRSFDESAIGSICALYPLEILPGARTALSATVDELCSRYVDEHGFFHPIIHSGYNTYLTMQLAHCYLLLDEVDRAWEVANTIFDHMKPPYLFPEASNIYGSGVMGDGHHGWAAAEIILFLRDCLIMEKGNVLKLLYGLQGRFMNKSCSISKTLTKFGTVQCSFDYENENRAVLKIQNDYNAEFEPEYLEVYITGNARKITPALGKYLLKILETEKGTVVRLTADAREVLFEF